MADRDIDPVELLERRLGAAERDGEGLEGDEAAGVEFLDLGPLCVAHIVDAVALAEGAALRAELQHDLARAGCAVVAHVIEKGPELGDIMLAHALDELTCIHMPLA